MLSDGFLCDSHRIQTCNLLIRSQMLYSVELANQFASFRGASIFNYRVGALPPYRLFVIRTGFKPVTF